jgi:Ca2+-binding EF-hand superfamily protein
MLTIDEVGGMKEKGKKIMVVDDFYPIFAKVKNAKNQGGIHDFVEILKLYDKNEDGTILGRELFRLLTNLGEKLTKEEAKGLMKELCEPEDDEGFMPFMPFLEKMCSNES